MLVSIGCLIVGLVIGYTIFHIKYKTYGYISINSVEDKDDVVEVHFMLKKIPKKDKKIMLNVIDAKKGVS